jgi:hypothetical protein|tara:strand:+ start:20 stop:208 length:189 start_codon:yes stop_codon:yes gene_type:complete
MRDSVTKMQEQQKSGRKTGSDKGVWVTQKQIDEQIRRFGNPNFDEQSGASKGKTEHPLVKPR